MTHEEALSLLPAYALGALDQDVEALEAHLEGCDVCTAELASYLEATVRLGEAVETVEPPRALRAAVLARAPATRTAPARRSSWWAALAARLSPAVAAAAVVVVVLGASAGIAFQQQQLQSAHAQLALDERGLALLTSTDTTVVRLDPVVPSLAHGHWYHRPGVNTQVLVVEFMPPLVGQDYYGWLRLADGSWVAAGKFTLDEKGYGRLILVGGDGSNVRGVEVTRQAQATAQPEGEVVLHWASP